MGGNIEVVVDMLEGFTRRGNLKSDRIERLIPKIHKRLKGTPEGTLIVFLADHHSPDDEEFQMFPHHCVVGSGEEEVVPELRGFITGRPKRFERNKTAGVLIPKTRYSGFYNTELDDVLRAWLDETGREKGDVEVNLTGDCTDICVLYTAQEFRNRGYKVNVIRDCVDTYDVPREVAERLGVPEHDADSINEFVFKHMRDILGVNVI
ncbi:MAG: isochorismatase family cysteine hydrolase [bacterium]